MTKKERIYRLIEVYLNDINSSQVEQMYGKGAKIKIHHITHVISSNSLFVEAVIILGDLINEEVLDRDLADLLIQDAMVYFYPDCPVKVMVRWDV